MTEQPQSNLTRGARIRAAVEAWPEVETAPHRFGGVEFRLGRRELGHLHGDRLADLPFPRRVRDELVAAGRARPHHVLPSSGWVSFPIASDDDVDAAIELFRLAYTRALQAQGKPFGLARRDSARGPTRGHPSAGSTSAANA